MRVGQRMRRATPTDNRAGTNGDFACRATAADGCSPRTTLQQGAFDVVVLQMLPFSDHWRDAAAAVDALFNFEPMPATAELVAIAPTWPTSTTTCGRT